MMKEDPLLVPGPWFKGLIREAQPAKRPRRRGGAAKTETSTLALERNGRVVPGAEGFRRALAVKASELIEQNRGGGITALLLPRNRREIRRLIKDREQYTLRHVQIRNRGRFEDLRIQLCNPGLLVDLIRVYPEARKPTIKNFAFWLHEEMVKTDSAAHRIVLAHAPNLLTVKRKRTWIHRMLLKKMSR